MINKPQNFEDLLELQKLLDEEVGKPRENGFMPRKRTEMDILLSLDDEFQEWLRELPQKYNFKTWKQKEYSREKELEEFTDCLFFFLQYLNNCDDDSIIFFKKYYDDSSNILHLKIKDVIYLFKSRLWDLCIPSCFSSWIEISYLRGFTKQEILDTYWSKWQKNMTRINKDWSLDYKKD